VQLFRGRFGCLVTVDTCGSFEEKRRVHQYGSQRQAAVPQKEKPRGSASSKLVRAGLLPGAELFEIIGLYSWDVNVGWSSRSTLKRGSVVHTCSARLEMGTAKIATRRPAFAQLKITEGVDRVCKTNASAFACKFDVRGTVVLSMQSKA